MTILYINTGSSPNKGDGDTLRASFTKINQNFATLSTVTNLVRANTIPASSTSTGLTNQVAFTGTDMYVCVAPNSWLKFSGTTF